jgi:hypothetical protein
MNLFSPDQELDFKLQRQNADGSLIICTKSVLSVRMLAFFVLGGITWVALAQSPPGLVGTWQLISRIDRDANGNTVPEPSLGADPAGYLIYDNSGHVAVQMMAKHRDSNAFQVTAPSAANNLAHVGGYDAYFGRYEVDLAKGTVTHILEGSLLPADVGRRLTRRFKLDGNTLTIQFEPGGESDRRITRTLVWRRATH